MHIAELQLVNYKYFDNMILATENRNVIVLIGPNGVGKSCIFDAIFSASEHSKYASVSKDDTYYKKNKDENYFVEITLADGTKLSPGVRHNYARFYGRTSYRFTKEISRKQIGGQTGDSVNKDNDGKIRLNDLDQRIENDVEVALSEMLVELQKQSGKIDRDIVNAVIGPSNESFDRIFGVGNFRISNIVDPVQGENNRCDVVFEKNSKKFSFKNLSAGEKEIFDIIFNFHRRKEKFIRDGVYYIDEPDLHINTKIQRALFNELVRLTKEINAQLWLSTHSLGFMRGAQDIAKNTPKEIAILEFTEMLANGEQRVTPKDMSRNDWKRILETALDDLSVLVSPQIIYYCEGKCESISGSEEGVDALAYKKIFDDHHDVDFVSSGGGNQPKFNSLFAAAILQKLSSNKIKILVLKDGDYGTTDGTLMKSEERSQALISDSSLCILSRLELENYLCDIRVIEIYCERNGIQFNKESLSGYDVIKDNLKTYKPAIMKAINHRGPWNNMPFLEFADIIYKEKEGVLKSLYDCLKIDLRLN